jgi:hypothetical protein
MTSGSTQGHEIPENSMQCQYLRRKLQTSGYVLERCLFPALPSLVGPAQDFVGGMRALWESGLAGTVCHRDGGTEDLVGEAVLAVSFGRHGIGRDSRVEIYINKSTSVHNLHSEGQFVSLTSHLNDGDHAWVNLCTVLCNVPLRSNRSSATVQVQIPTSFHLQERRKMI